MARHSRVDSSITASSFTCRPSSVGSATNSYDQTWWIWSARWQTQPSSLPLSVVSLRVQVLVHARSIAYGSSRPQTEGLPGQSPHLSKPPWFIISPVRLLSLSTGRLIEQATCSMLQNLLEPQTATHLSDRSSPTFEVYYFPFAASFKISISTACSATIFFNRTFSFRRALSSFAISGCIPPYSAASGHMSVL